MRWQLRRSRSRLGTALASGAACECAHGALRLQSLDSCDDLAMSSDYLGVIGIISPLLARLTYRLSPRELTSEQAGRSFCHAMQIDADPMPTQCRPRDLRIEDQTPSPLLPISRVSPGKGTRTPCTVPCTALLSSHVDTRSSLARAALCQSHLAGQRTQGRAGIPGHARGDWFNKFVKLGCARWPHPARSAKRHVTCIPRADSDPSSTNQKAEEQ